MTINKFKYACLGLFLSLSVLLGFSLIYKVQNVVLGNIIDTSQSQIIQINKKSNIIFFKGKKLTFKYNNKQLTFNISNYYIEKDYYYITLNKYLVIENNIYNLFVNTDKQILLIYIFQNIF